MAGLPSPSFGVAASVVACADRFGSRRANSALSFPRSGDSASFILAAVPRVCDQFRTSGGPSAAAGFAFVASLDLSWPAHGAFAPLAWSWRPIEPSMVVSDASQR